MPTVSEVSQKAKQFIKSTLSVEGKIISAKKVSDGWEVEAETFEEDSYYRSIRPDYRVVERRFYQIKLNPNLEVVSYKRKEEKEKEEPA